MSIATRCLPVGALPYTNIRPAAIMISKLFSKMPFIAPLPNISAADTVTHWLFENVPGIIYENEELKLQVGNSTYEESVSKFDKVFNSPEYKESENFGFHAEFFEKYLQIIKKFNSPNACINVLGPFTTYQMFSRAAKSQILVDKSYRKLYTQVTCVKALWIIKKIKEINPDTIPIVILEEPLLGQLGTLKRESESITVDFIVNSLSKVIEKIKKAGAIVGVQCFEKCDWSVPIKAGADIISFDAYNNPNNLSIMPDVLTRYLKKGGIINWGIVPVFSENLIKGSNFDYLYERLCSTIDGVKISGVPAALLYQNAMVSLNGDSNHLPVIFSEKANILANQLGSKLASGV